MNPFMADSAAPLLFASFIFAAALFVIYEILLAGYLEINHPWAWGAAIIFLAILAMFLGAICK